MGKRKVKVGKGTYRLLSMKEGEEKEGIIKGGNARTLLYFYLATLGMIIFWNVFFLFLQPTVKGIFADLFSLGFAFFVLVFIVFEISIVFGTTLLHLIVLRVVGKFLD